MLDESVKCGPLYQLPAIGPVVISERILYECNDFTSVSVNTLDLETLLSMFDVMYGVNAFALVPQE